VRPGDSVDLFMLLRRDGTDGEIGRTQARLLLSKVRVLAYGRAAVTQTSGGATASTSASTSEQARDTSAMSTAANAAQIDGGTPPAGGPGSNDPVNARTAVIAVPVEQVDALTLADTAGRLVMALRSPADTQVADRDIFAPSGTVLIPTGGQAALAAAEPSTRAAAGLLLDQLVTDKGGKGRNTNTAPMPVLASLSPVSARRGAGSVTGSRASAGGVEVIRGDKREIVGW
jgi:pilus assembly protein CpaB